MVKRMLACKNMIKNERGAATFFTSLEFYIIVESQATQPAEILLLWDF